MSKSKGVPSRRNDPWGFGLEGLDRQAQQRCIECGTYTTGRHHVIPVSLGGTRQVPLCATCHCKAHGEPNALMYRGELIQRALFERTMQGKRLGPPVKLTPSVIERITLMRTGGLSIRSIAKALSLSAGAVHKALQKSSTE